MATRLLVVGEVDAVGGKLVAERARTGDELVVSAAGQIHARHGGLTSSHAGLQLLVAHLVVLVGLCCCGEVAKDGLVTGNGVEAGVQHRDGAGQRGNVAERIRVLKTVADGAKATHGKAGDEGILASVRQREGGSHDARQLLADERAVVVERNEAVHVVHVVARGHDHGKVLLLGPALDTAIGTPVGVVAKHAVQQIQRLERLGARLVVAGLGRHLVDRQDHVDRDSAQKRV